MTLKELLRAIRKHDEGLANEAEGFLENLSEQAGKAAKLERDLGSANAEMEKLRGQKEEATGEAIAERKKRQAMQGAIQPFQEAGLVDKEMKITLGASDLAGLKDASNRMTEMSKELAGFRAIERRRTLTEAIETVYKEKGFTSGLKVLLREAERQGEALDPKNAEALGTFVTETVAELGEELFKVEAKKVEGEEDKDGNQKDANADGDKKPKHAIPSPTGHKVTDPGDGRPAKINLSTGVAGVSPDQVPTFGEFLKQSYEAANLPVPRVIAHRAGQAQTERDQRKATTVGKGADDKPVTDVTKAVS